MPRLDFNAAAVPEDTNRRTFDPLPEGDYVLQVIDSEVRATKSGTGQMLVLTLEVVDGSYRGRRIWDRLNIRNQNPTAQHIAENALADLCKALGIANLIESETLHYKPFGARVKVRPAEGQYGPSNTVRYKRTTGAPPRPSGAKPWQRG
jgi:hypothetical protein